MKREEPILEEQLDAFLDGQLDDKERGAILEAIDKDKELAAQLCELRQLKDMVLLAYHAPPLPSGHDRPVRQRRGRLLPLAAAAVLLLALGGVGGWLGRGELPVMPHLPMQRVAQFNPATSNDTRIILQIGTMDPQRVEPALKAAEELLDANDKARAVKLEIIANAEGLGILRRSSPYAKRIQTIVATHRNVAFLACGIARSKARLREGRQIELIPEAQVVPAALEQILSRLQDGWLYIKA